MLWHRFGVIRIREPLIPIRRAEEGPEYVQDTRLSTRVVSRGSDTRYRPVSPTLFSAQPVGIGRIGRTSRGSHKVLCLPVM